MEDQYGIADLRQLLNGRPLFPPMPDLLPNHRTPPPHPFDMLLFRSDSTTPGSCSAAATGGCYSGFESGGGGGDIGPGRWPRQETLTLLEIRSKLDSKFKEANQKGPLWDEISRIMSEEHGYQRSGKKCREKFENLYKYYKKTKEGKAGRQDGKHYRFFRQLEALYGDSSNNNSAGATSFNYNKNSNSPLAVVNQESFHDTSLSFTNYTDTSSSDDTEINDRNKKRREWKLKIRDFIDAQMKKLMDKQEAWMDKMMQTIEQKEQERLIREEQWRKQDAERIEREHKFWANERAWIESRDAALMEALQMLTGNQNDDVSVNSVWAECEVMKLIELRKAMEVKFQERGDHNEVIKKRKDDDSKSCGSLYYDRHDQQPVYSNIRVHDHGSNSSPNLAITTTDNCFRYFMGDAYGRIMP